MLAAMNDEFNCRFENIQPQEMLQILNDSFGMPDDIERHKTSCAIFNARMRDGASVTDHVLYLFEMIEHLSKLGFPCTCSSVRMRSLILCLSPSSPSLLIFG